jgi:YhcH/YjgK/YiaL family protein
MWIGKIEDFKNCLGLSKEVKEIVSNFFAENDLRTLPNGRYELPNGDFVNICEFETKENDGIFEAHKKYVDIHYTIFGQEILCFSDKIKEITKAYDEKDDYYLCTVKNEKEVVLKGDNLCVCLVDDLHKGGILANEKQTVKKAIFKIKID